MDDLSRHVAAHVAGEESGHVGYILHLATAAQGNLLLPFLADFKEKYAKPGNVYLGVVHRLDRPVSGVVLFAKTSKALPRLNKMFSTHEQVHKTYLAIVGARPPQEAGTLTH